MIVRQQPRKIWAAVIPITLSVAMAACIVYRAVKPGKRDRGILSAHAVHGEQGLDCTDCHSWEEGERVIPGHELCSICHEIDEEATDKGPCGFCHTRDDQSIDPLIKRLSIEIKWEHPDHLEKDVACLTCHKVPGIIPQLPRGPLKPWCMDCHVESEPKILDDGTVDVAFTQNECRVCHNELNVDVVPQFRGGVRVFHDMPEVWEQVHGRESVAAPIFCAQCHDAQAHCEECHNTNPPKNHTLAWRRKSHGLHATWNRAKCSVCHDEEGCLQCHQNTKPSSHRAGWDSPASLHCISCHHPVTQTNCTVCHEKVDHARAMPSPHNFGIFPPRCGLCHPGGLPHRAPHPLNSTMRCIVCHR